MLTSNESALVRDTQDWLLELRQLRDKALARCDAVRAEELQAEIEEVTACLDGIVEAAREARETPEAAKTSRHGEGRQGHFWRFPAVERQVASL
jgi:hypothetical protein